MQHYILVNGKPQAATLVEWAQWFEDDDNRRIDHTDLPDQVYVSTVFLGVDHGYTSGEPLFFETMVFGGPHTEYQERYLTLGEAKQGHYRIVQNLRAGQEPDAQ